MKNGLISLGSIIFLFNSYVTWAIQNTNKSTQEETSELSSAQLLGSTPLKNFKIFTFHPQISFPRPLRDKVNQELSKELKKIGKVETLEFCNSEGSCNPIGYGMAQALVTIFAKDISTLKEKTLPVIQTSFLVASPIKIEKTGTSCRTYIWSASTFAEGNMEENNEQNILASLKAVVKQFIQDYQKDNEGQKEKPLFYLYTD